MNERPFGHTPGHSRHDRLLVARFAAGQALAGEAEEGRRLLDSCSDCARLAADLRQLSTSIAALPAPARTRSFRLTVEQAERLRGNAFERFLRRLAMPGLTMLRPVAGVALAIGLTIMVVGTGLPVVSGPASAPTRQDLSIQEAGGSPPAGVTGQPSPGLGATDDGKTGQAVQPFATDAPPELTDTGSGRGSVESPTDTRRPSSTDNDIMYASPTEPTFVAPVTAAPSEPSADTTRLLLIYGGTTLAMVSFGLLLLAWFARRRLEDPLLR